MATSHQPLLERPNFYMSVQKPLCLILSLATVISLSSLISTQFLKHNPSTPELFPHQICHGTHDPLSCMTMLAEITSNKTMQKVTPHLLQIFLARSMFRVQQVIRSVTKIRREGNHSPKENMALMDCVELLDMSKHRIRSSMSAMERQQDHHHHHHVMISHHHDAHTWLSSMLANHVTCLDGLEGHPSRAVMEQELNDLISRARTCLAILVAYSPQKSITSFLEGLEGNFLNFPSWISSDDRRLLAAVPGEIKADAVVAVDGSGDYKTVAEAVAAAPRKSKSRYVIHVKKGVYKENVEIKNYNLMMVGDGMDSTILTGSLNVVDGSTTFRSATVAAVGDGFIAQDIWFQNTAGPEKHQAVALRVGADKSVINRCRMDAYQDTLYTHSNRQFYRDSFITGTIDFIFGDASVVFQNCELVARKPMTSQSNMVTAQGREDPNENTGTSIQNCNIRASSELKPIEKSIKSYLGRPWKEYSRTVVMESTIGGLIDPAGWAPWDGEFALNTLYFGEFKNQGPGADTSKRVNWSGYHVINDPTEAKKFTVAELIDGGSWLPSTGVPYKESL